MNISDLLDLSKFTRAGNKDGGEYHGPCPGCQGRDRFHVWPEQNDGSGTYWCRQCDKHGDVLQFMMDFQGLTYPQACERAGQAPKERRPDSLRPPAPSKPAWTPRPASSTEELWQAHAEKFIAYCADQLHKTKSALDWLADRGITPETARRFRLGWNPKNQWRARSAWGVPDVFKDDGTPKKLFLPYGLIIPLIDHAGQVIRIRIRRPDPRPANTAKYYVVPGSATDCMVIHPEKDAMAVVESELDAILLAQAAGDVLGAVGLGSVPPRPDAATAAVLGTALVILDCLDADAAGQKDSHQADSVWRTAFPRSRRWPVPVGKDPGEAFAAGVDIRAWLLAGLPPRWRVGLAILKNPPDRAAAVAEDSAPVVEGPACRLPDPAADQPAPKALTLGHLMSGTPMRILVSPIRLKIVFSESNWLYASTKNWERFARVSDAVFLDADLRDRLHRLDPGLYSPWKIDRALAALAPAAPADEPVNDQAVNE